MGPTVALGVALASLSGTDLRPAPWADEVQARIAAEARRLGRHGHIAVSAIDVARGESFGFRDDVPMYLASGVKLAFMTAVFAAVEEGRLGFDEQLSYTEDDLRDGAPRLNKRPVGSTVPVRTLLADMMQYSDNAASDLFVDRLGPDFIARTLVEQGLDEFGPISRLIEVRRGFYRELDPRADDLSAAQVRAIRWTPIWDRQLRRLERELGVPPRTFNRKAIQAAYERFYATGINHAPMRAVAKLLHRMLTGQLVSEKASAAMVELMLGAQTSRNRLLGRLPRGTPVAHKTGSQFLRFCDLGVIFLPGPSPEKRGDPVIIAICTAKADLNRAERAIAQSARLIYDAVLRRRKS
ncbi:MAG: serine hydrolase [Myxococcota bacterium]